MMIVSYSPMASSDASSGSVGFCPPQRAVDREVDSLGGCKLVLKVPDAADGFVLKPMGEGFKCVGSASSTFAGPLRDSREACPRLDGSARLADSLPG